jgi:hypothetical protein
MPKSPALQLILRPGLQNPQLPPADYLLLGEVTNTPSPAINSGVIVSLTGSTWTVMRISYLTSLTLGEDSTIIAPEGHKLTMTVNGAPRPIKAGTYKGIIVLTVASL